MAKKSKSWKDQLDREMKHLTFTKQNEVIDCIHPVTRKQKVHSFLNKEIELSLLPFITISILILLSFGIKHTIINDEKSITSQTKELIEIEGHFYWKDDFEKLVIKHEN